MVLTNFFRWKLTIEPGPPKFWISDELDRSVLGSLLNTLEVCKWTYTLTPHRRKTLILSESVSTIVLQSEERRFVMSPVFVVSKKETSCFIIQLKIQFQTTSKFEVQTTKWDFETYLNSLVRILSPILAMTRVKSPPLRPVAIAETKLTIAMMAIL